MAKTCQNASASWSSCSFPTCQWLVGNTTARCWTIGHVKHRETQHRAQVVPAIWPYQQHGKPVLQVSPAWRGQNTLERRSSPQNMAVVIQINSRTTWLVSSTLIHHVSTVSLVKPRNTLGELVNTAIFNPTSCAKLVGEVWLVSRKQRLMWLNASRLILGCEFTCRKHLFGVQYPIL